MKKLLIGLVTALAFMNVGVGTTANASSWHRGAPKIARGTWSDEWNYPKGGEYDILYISKHKLIFDDNTPYLTHLKYKKIGYHTYKFRGYEFELGHNQSTAAMYFTKHTVRFYSYGHVYLTK